MFPYDWYWLADDGRLYSSSAQMQVVPDDQKYQDWVEAGNTASFWPRDETGEQTDAELQSVLFEYRLAVDLKAYAFMLRDQKEHDGMTVTTVPGITQSRTDSYTQELLSRYHNAVLNNASFVAMWVLPDRSTLKLNKKAITDFFVEMTEFTTETYGTYATVIDGIDNGTITTIGQIDTAFGIKLARSKRVDIGWQS
jgi:hypothetical protein